MEMLSVEQCREVLGSDLKDEEINKIRSEMGILADLILDIYFAENKLCKNQEE